MTVKELIELLQEYEPDRRVMVDGYQGGLEDIFKNSLNLYSVGLDVNGESYYGRHEATGSYMYQNHRDTTDIKIVDALVISRDGYQNEEK